MLLIAFLFSVTLQNTLAQYRDAYWTQWKDWSDCSRTCGGGITKSTRTCIVDLKNTTRTPRCEGESVRYQMCNIQDCPINSVDYRMLQCSKYNNKPYKGKLYKWEGFTHSAGECELKCMPENNFFYVTFDSKVADGTRCNDLSLDVCINGACVPVGCDMQLYSKARVDSCGICNGDGTKCKIMKGNFKLVSTAYGYVEVVTIPAGATSIKFTEDYKTTNFLAVTSNGKSILNADYAITSSFGTKSYEGLIIEYERSERLNQIKINGPTTLPLQFHIYVATYTKRQIVYNYEYYVPNSFNQVESTISAYEWVTGEWGKCSKECATGERTRQVYCAKKNSQTQVEDFNCKKDKPIDKEECNTQACPARWYISQWSPCSRSCGKGYHTRRVHCVVTGKDGNIEMLDNSKCPGKTPAAVETCYEKKKCPEWKEGTWSECSRSCGNGVQSRTVECIDNDNNRVSESECPDDQRPPVTQECFNFPCGAQWVAEDWTECSSVCGVGMRHRKVTCNNRAGVAVPRSHCNPSHEPTHFENCQVVGPCKPMWHTSQWSKCSAKCGYGMQIRVVTCAEKNGDDKFQVTDNKYCNATLKPETSRRCEDSKPCQVNYFVSKWRKCSVSCGIGYQLRDVRCYADRTIDYSQKHCANLIKPFNVRICRQARCPGSKSDGDDDDSSEVSKPIVKTRAPVVTRDRRPSPTSTTTVIKKTTKRKRLTLRPIVDSRRLTKAKIVFFDGPAEIQINKYAEYKCIVTGYPKPGVVWTYGGKSVAVAFDKFKTAKRIAAYNRIESSLYVQHSQYTHAQKLKCFARNIYGYDESELEVKVSDGERISITSTTTPAFTDTTTDQDFTSTEYQTSTPYASTDFSSTTLPPVDKVPVRVVITNPPGSRGFTPARIVSLSGPENLKAGENADYQCIAGGEPPPKITWRLNGKTVDKTRFRILNSRYGSRLVLITGIYKDSGELKCTATNTLGTDAEKLLIQVSGVPLVSIFPKKPSYEEGSRVVLRCKAEGSPAPQITWKKDDKVFYGDNKRVIVLQDRIVFNSILPKDSGKYFCKGFNSQGANIDSISVSIQRTDGIRIKTCRDDNTRAECSVVASMSRLCTIPHYNNVCCETCRGRLPR